MKSKLNLTFAKIAAVETMIDDNRSLYKALVTDAGDLLYVRPTDDIAARGLSQLAKVVKEHYPNCAPRREIGAMEYNEHLQSKERGKHKTAIGRIGKKQLGIADQILLELITRAASMKASDFFLDIWTEKQAFLRFKIYGFTHEIDTFDVDTARRLAVAMWRLSGTTEWNPAEACHCTFTAEVTLEGAAQPSEYRLRAASMIEAGRPGYLIACRLRDPGSVMPLDQAGYTAQQMQDIWMLNQAPGGLSVFSGPTDSGKSTSLTSMVAAMPTNMRKLEIADPVEVYLDHCTHVQLKKEKNSDNFDQIMATTVLVNPDFLLLQEIRDKRTAAAAISMAQQGKQVHSTLHSTTCAGVPSRLHDLGISLNLLGFKDFFCGMVSQNLVPLLCRDCALTQHRDPAEHRRHQQLFESSKLRYINPQGCAHCTLGVKGQTLVAEVYPLLRAGDRAYSLIRQGAFAELAEYMTLEVGVDSKHAMAADKIVEGLIDPIITARRIGYFDPKKAWNRSA